MKKMKKSSIVFFALTLLMVATNVAVVMGSSYNFTIYRAIADETDGVLNKDKYSSYGIVSVLSTSAEGYYTDYLLVGSSDEKAVSDYAHIRNNRGSGGHVNYTFENYRKSLYVKLRGADNSLTAPPTYRVSGMWSANQQMEG